MRQIRLIVLAAVCAIPLGCGRTERTGSTGEAHRHELPAHMPRSLAHLCEQIRSRIREIDGANDDVKAELTDLVAWAPEFAADTELEERRWIPIYELSERIRKSIESDPQDWGSDRQNQIVRLCQVSEDAWRSLDPESRVERYQGHDHDHAEHDHAEHDHAEHDHAEHDHAEHDHRGLDESEAGPTSKQTLAETESLTGPQSEVLP